MRTGRLLLLLCGVAVSKGEDSLCLPNGVRNADRRFISNNGGFNMSISLFEGAWPSSEVLTYMLKLLIQEALGYHAHIHPVLGANGASVIYALAGCLDFDALQDKQCGVNETEIHVSIESWIGSYLELQVQFHKDYPTQSAIDLGSVGYVGEESIYIREEQLDAAYHDSGIALDFYKSYNVSHYDPKKYFDSLDAVPTSELKLCNTTDFSNPSRMNNYAKWSGDYEGMELQADGGYVAKCFDGYWWAAPVCRSNTSECFPVITAGNGWRLHAIMAWVSAYAFPAAVAISNLWSDFVRHGREIKALFYWWVPDSTFVEQQPHQVVFPRHSAREWHQGNKRTSGGGTYISKMVSRSFPQQAREVTAFLEGFSLELQEVQDMLLEFSRTDSKYDVACRWIRENEARWSQWVPVDTSCSEGFGLVDSTGALVNNRAEAVSCGLCPPGTSSTSLIDEVGPTYWCQLCPAGHSQPNSFSTSCEPCPKGTKTEMLGSETCQPCDEGFYQNATGSTSCHICGSSRTTRLLGAASEALCVCEENLIEIDGVCTPCRVGLECPAGSTVKHLVENVDVDPRKPHLTRGYFSTREDPLNIYRCLSGCPGGAPGVCAGGRIGLTCGECPRSFYLADGECRTCQQAVLPRWWWLGAMLFIVLVILGYYVVGSQYKARASALFCCEASLGIACALFQNLGVISTVPLEWPSEVSGVLIFSSFFMMDLEGLGANCLAGSTTQRYIFSSLILPMALLIIPIIGALSNVVPWLTSRGLEWQMKKTLSLMGSFMQAAFITMVSVGMAPFMCYEHPNGESSLLKETNVFCGSSEHRSMSAIGACMVGLATIFVMYYLWGVITAPSWSGSDRLEMLRFILHRFRPSCWWFGMVVLLRGLAVSLPAVIAAGMPNVIIIMLLCIQLLYLIFVAWMLPWKGAILNLIDCVVSGVLVLLLALALESLDAAPSIIGPLRTALLLFTVGTICFLTVSLATSVAVQVLLKKPSAGRLINLGRAPRTSEIVTNLKELAEMVTSTKTDEEVAEVLSKLSYHDLIHVYQALSILSDELELTVSTSPFSQRICNGRRTAVAPPKGEETGGTQMLNEVEPDEIPPGTEVVKESL